MWMENLRRDVGLALRSLRRRPGYAAVVALALGLGIGANTAVFSVVDAMLLRPLPYAFPQRLFVLWGALPEQGRFDAHLSGPELAAIWDGARSLEVMGAVWARPGVMRDGDGPAEEVEVGWVTPGFLETLGVVPHIGRLPTFEELVADPGDVMVLSFELWQRRFGADPALLGRRVEFDDENRTVIGVMPRGFRMLFPPDQGVPETLAAWLPWGGRDYQRMSRGFRVFTPVGRLAPGVSATDAAEELHALAGRVRAENLEYARSGFDIRLEPLASGLVAHVRPTLLILMGVVSLVLLVACANVANLTLVRALDAEHELRVRAALGAGRGGLFRQLLTESVLLGGLGAATGLLFATVGVRLARLLEPGRLPRIEDVSVDGRALAYAGGTALVASLVFGGLAALHALRAAESAPLQDTARAPAPGPARTRRLLMVSELALSLVLLAAAGLLVRSHARLGAVDPGFDPRGVLTARVSLPDIHYRYRDQGLKIAGFYSRLEERLRALPGVEAVGATTGPPLSGKGFATRPYAWRRAEGEVEWGSAAAVYRTVTPGWFRAAGVRLLAGRALAATDDWEHPVVVVVDASLARKAWPGRHAVGRPIRVEIFREGEFQAVWAEVVGVIDSVRVDRLEEVEGEQVYLAHAQSPQRTMYPTLRAASDPLGLVPAVGREVAALERDLPIFDVRLAEEHLADATAVSRFALFTLVAFATVAALLAAAGVYAVMAYSVNRRRFEIGVRLALGAWPARVLREVVGEGMGLAAAGVAAGVGGSLVLTRSLSGLLFGVSPQDPLSLGCAALVLSVTTLAACWVPARRASRLEPRQVLNRR